MKRILSVFIAVLMIIGTLCVPVSSKTIIGTVYTNVAQGASYTCSTPYEGTALEYQKVSGSELTDGVFGNSDYGTEWVGLDKRLASPAVVVLDLGELRNDISRLSIQFRYGSTDSVSLPTKLVYYYSADGATYTEFGEATVGSDGSYYQGECILDTPVTGRYFKAEITHGGGLFVFLSEFEVCYGEEGEIEVPDEVYPSLKLVGTSDCVLEDGILRGIRAGTKITEFSQQLSQGLEDVKIVSVSGTEKDGDDLIATGDVVSKYYKGNVVDSFTVIIDGDVDCNGNVDTSDYLKVKRHVLGTYTITDIGLDAACVSSNTVGAADYLMIKRSVLRTYDLHTKYLDEVKLYEEDMKVTWKSDKLFSIETTYQGRPLKITFDKKEWGTWNIGTFYYDNKALAGGGTDWEYVYRAGATSSGWTWSGGNHGNETLLSLAIYVDDPGEETELDFRVGDWVMCNSVRIVEKTRLHWGDASNYYAEVTRTYRIMGNRIELDVDTNHVKDCYFFQSYTCMFPVSKAYGRNYTFYHTDGTTHSGKTTDGTVYEPYGNHYDQGNSATKLTFWGDTKPNWKFDVEIHTPYDSTLDFSNTNKVMLWDMNTSHDKLYFSKYEAGVPTLIPAGYNFGTSSSWTFYVEE